MKNSFLLFSIVIVFNYFVKVYTKNDYYIVSILRNHNDINYDDETPEIQLKRDIFVNKKMNIIYNYINKTQHTYTTGNGTIDEKLNELKNSTQLLNLSQLKKRDENEKNESKTETMLLFTNKRKQNNHMKRSLEFSNNSTIEYIPFESELVEYGCPVSNYYAIIAYLSDENVEAIRKLDFVKYCEKSESFKYPELTNKLRKRQTSNNDNNNSNVYYDINEIQKETQWTKVSVQEFSNDKVNHLSLLSQSINNNENEPIDKNYYYPSTAGKGIDMYFIDEGIVVNQDEFNTDERTVTCDAIIDENGIHYTSGDEKNTCVTGGAEYPEHGVSVASSGAGTISGVAKKANIHMVSIELTMINILKSLDVVLLNAKPYKTIINLSFGGYGHFYNSINDKLEDLIQKGYIIFVAAGNEGVNCCAPKDSSDFHFFSGYRKAITVGGVYSKIENNKYYRHEVSNYGDCVDIFAPAEIVNENNADNMDYGTSISAPIAAGVAATIMSEHPEIQFDNELMRKTLIDMSTKDAIEDINSFEGDANTPNRFINNGKLSVYTPPKNPKCGALSKNQAKCDDGCCSKDGECIPLKDSFDDKCFIENGCQSEFGYCTSMDKSDEECEKEIKEHEECQIDVLFKSYPDLDEFDQMKQCITFQSKKCKKFYENLYLGKSICSFAKEKQSFGYIDTFDENVYSEYFDMCNGVREYHEENCNIVDDFREGYLNYDYDYYDYCLFSEEVSKLDNYSLQYSCMDFKSVDCSEFKNEIMSNPSCSLLKEYYSNEGFSSIGYAVDSYDEIYDACEETLKDPVEQCENEIKEYKEKYEKCHFNYTYEDFENIDYYDFIEKCSVEEKCRELYNYMETPICTYARQFENIDILDKIDSARETYTNICKYGISDDIMEFIIDECRNEIQSEPDNCYFDMKEMPEDTFNNKCETIKLGGCKRSSLCELAAAYNDNLKGESYTNYLCQKGFKNEFISSCKNSLRKTESCLFENEASNNIDLYYQCNLFNEEVCQEFYQEDSIERYPECVIPFKNDWIPYNFNSKYQYYSDICPGIIETMDLNSTLPTTSELIETTTTVAAAEPTTSDSVEKSTDVAAAEPTTSEAVETTTTVAATEPTTTESIETTSTVVTFEPVITESIEKSTDVAAAEPVITESIEKSTDVAAAEPTTSEAVETTTSKVTNKQTTKLTTKKVKTTTAKVTNKQTTKPTTKKVKTTKVKKVKTKKVVTKKKVTKKVVSKKSKTTKKVVTKNKKGKN